MSLEGGSTSFSEGRASRDATPASPSAGTPIPHAHAVARPRGVPAAHSRRLRAAPSMAAGPYTRAFPGDVLLREIARSEAEGASSERPVAGALAVVDAGAGAGKGLAHAGRRAVVVGAAPARPAHTEGLAVEHAGPQALGNAATRIARCEREARVGRGYVGRPRVRGDHGRARAARQGQRRERPRESARGEHTHPIVRGPSVAQLAARGPS